MSVGLVWAQSSDGVVGADGSIPWRIPEDLAHFRALTSGSTVVMGRRTWESLPSRFRPLPDRSNVVLSRSSYVAPGARVCSSLDDALDVDGPVWVLGGASVWSAALPKADRIVITDVELSVVGDTYAPRVGPEWIIASDGGWQQSTAGLRYRIRDLSRV